MAYKKISAQEKENIKIGQRYTWLVIPDKDVWEVTDIVGSFITTKKVLNPKVEVETREDLFIKEWELLKPRIISDTEALHLVEVLYIIDHLTGLNLSSDGSDIKCQHSCVNIAKSKGWELINYVDSYSNEARLNELNGIDNPIAVKGRDRTRVIAIALLWGLIKEYIVQYEGGRLSIGKLGELLGISYEETCQVLKVYQIPLYLGVENEAELTEDIKNAN